MNMVVSSAVAATAIPVSQAAALTKAEVEAIEAGKQFEVLLSKYTDARFRWGALAREADAKTDAAFANKPEWTGPSGPNPKWAIKAEILKENGGDEASDRLAEIYEEMEPLAQTIMETPTKTIEGLRAKALLSIWNCFPICASHSGNWSFEDEDSFCGLLEAVVAVTGLSKTYAAIDKRLMADRDTREDNTDEIAQDDIAAPADPIFAAIEAHKRTYEYLSGEVSAHSMLESEIPLEKRQTKIDAYEEKIVETDDPRWIASERGLHAAFDAETDAACALCDIRPTTTQGLRALLNYALAHDKDGHSWPTDLESGDSRNITRSWHHFLLENVLAAVGLGLRDQAPITS